VATPLERLPNDNGGSILAEEGSASKRISGFVELAIFIFYP
jgi:hypothetical protein